MSANSRLTHEDREHLVLSDLQKHFPNFGDGLFWEKVPDGQDPPDFRNGQIGLELVEWLNGDQMRAAKTRESLRDHLYQILAKDCDEYYRTRNFRDAFLTPGMDRIRAKDEPALRKQFFELAANVDDNWFSNPDRLGNSYSPCRSDLTAYPLVARYFDVRFRGGEPHGLPWIHPAGDGGAYDPADSVNSLIAAIEGKLTTYSTPERRQHLNMQGVAELNLLVHGGFNVHAYNTPTAPFTLEEICHKVSDSYGRHSIRGVFDRVWFFNSLDSADELNRLLGFPANAGRQRWLCQLWPEFRILDGCGQTLREWSRYSSRVRRVVGF